MVNKIKASLLFMLLLAVPISAQQITVKAVTDSSKYKVGDYITYKLEFAYDKNIKINYPSVKDSIKNLEFIKEELPSKNESDKKIMESRVFVFSKYDSSIVNIPSYKVYYTDGQSQNFVAVNPVTITVEKIAVDTTKDIQDVKPPVEIPFNWVLALIIFGIAAALAFTGYYLYKHFKSKNLPKAKPEPKIPPYELALIQLKSLNEKQLWQNGQIKEYHSEITEIVRRYFEARFGFLALEMTTGEMLKCLEQSKEGNEIKILAEKFFGNADLVKFAKFVPMPSVNGEMMEQALDIVEKTRPVIDVNPKSGGENV
mgnify:CR=1 FL=1